MREILTDPRVEISRRSPERGTGDEKEKKDEMNGKETKQLTAQEACEKLDRDAQKHEIKALASDNEFDREAEKKKAARAQKIKRLINGKRSGKKETAAFTGMEREEKEIEQDND